MKNTILPTNQVINKKPEREQIQSFWTFWGKQFEKTNRCLLCHFLMYSFTVEKGIQVQFDIELAKMCIVMYHIRKKSMLQVSCSFFILRKKMSEDKLSFFPLCLLIGHSAGFKPFGGFQFVRTLTTKLWHSPLCSLRTIGVRGWGVKPNFCTPPTTSRLICKVLACWPLTPLVIVRVKIIKSVRWDWTPLSLLYWMSPPKTVLPWVIISKVDTKITERLRSGQMVPVLFLALPSSFLFLMKGNKKELGW